MSVCLSVCTLHSTHFSCLFLTSCFLSSCLSRRASAPSTSLASSSEASSAFISPDQPSWEGWGERGEERKELIEREEKVMTMEGKGKGSNEGKRRGDKIKKQRGGERIVKTLHYRHVPYLFCMKFVITNVQYVLAMYKSLAKRNGTIWDWNGFPVYVSQSGCMMSNRLL